MQYDKAKDTVYIIHLHYLLHKIIHFSLLNYNEYREKVNYNIYITHYLSFQTFSEHIFLIFHDQLIVISCSKTPLCPKSLNYLSHPSLLHNILSNLPSQPRTTPVATTPVFPPFQNHITLNTKFSYIVIG